MARTTPTTSKSAKSKSANAETKTPKSAPKKAPVEGAAKAKVKPKAMSGKSASVRQAKVGDVASASFQKLKDAADSPTAKDAIQSAREAMNLARDALNSAKATLNTWRETIGNEPNKAGFQGITATMKQLFHSTLEKTKERASAAKKAL